MNTKSVTESKEMSYIHIGTVFEELVFAKCRFLNLHILHFRCFIPCLGSKIITASSCIEKSEEIGCISLQSSKGWFRKIQIFEFAYPALLHSGGSLFRLSHGGI